MDIFENKVPRNVKNDYEGFNYFTTLFKETEFKENMIIRLDFSKCNWFEANLSAVLGTWATKMFNQKNKIELYKISNSIRKVLQRNGFYKRFKLEVLPDAFGTAIEYKEFKITQQEEFSQYLTRDVIPNIKSQATPQVLKSLKTTLNEVFTNVDFHANSDKVYTCGQYYHQNQNVAFTISDCGKTIGANVRKFLGGHLNDLKSIEWALIEDNSTKGITNNDEEAGGIGLYILKEFIYNNKGILQIVSGDGFYELNNQNVYTKNLDFHFPGTVVNIITKLEYSFNKF